MNWKSLGLNFLQSAIANVALGSLGKTLQSIGIGRLNAYMVHLGHAFGPPGLVHFSQLSEIDQNKLLSRVPVLKGNHTDWPKAFAWVPRTLTTWVGPAPKYEDVIDGNLVDPAEFKPIPDDGDWYVLPGYMASTTTEGIHNRLGWRWDDVDRYYSLSFTVKFYK